MVALEKFCFWLSVKTGCFIIGYLNVVLCCHGAMVGLGLAIYGAILKAWPIDNSINYETQMQLGDMVMYIGFGVLPVLAIVLTISTIFIVGLHKNKRSYVKVFVVFTIVTLALFSLFTLVSLAVMPRDIFVVSLISLGLQVYTYLVVKSHYDIMGEADQGETYNKSEKSAKF